MPASDLVILDEDNRRFCDVLEKLRNDANANLTFLLDRNGQQIAMAGSVEKIDVTSLASLTAGNVAATDGLAKLIGEKEFSILFHEGENEHLHISVVGGRWILVVLFDEKSSLGLVRLRVKKAGAELREAMDEVLKRELNRQFSSTGGTSPFSEITDDDIDALFS
jgi:predicted regulator of Ras-like GTPase activity (Roadblock/LC7/MglB family)